jgi:hypothetical protein
MWHAATPKTQLPFLADQAQLGLFSIGDLVMIFGGILIVAICLCRVLKNTLQQAFVQRIERPLQL